MKTNSELRAQMRNVLIADDDFDAFCLDYFSEIKGQFTMGMTRTQKENVLLERVDKVELERCLRDIAAILIGPSRQKDSATGMSSYGADELFRQVNYVTNERDRLLNYNIFINTMGSILPLLVGGQDDGRLDQIVEKIRELAESFKTAVNACRKACIGCGFWLKQEDRDMIEKYLNQHSSIIQMLDNHFAMLVGYSSVGNGRSVFLFTLHDQVQQFRILTSILDRMRKEIEQHLRQYSQSPQ